MESTVHFVLLEVKNEYNIMALFGSERDLMNNLLPALGLIYIFKNHLSDF